MFSTCKGGMGVSCGIGSLACVCESTYVGYKTRFDGRTDAVHCRWTPPPPRITLSIFVLSFYLTFSYPSDCTQLYPAPLRSPLPLSQDIGIVAKQRGAVNSSCQEKRDKAQQLEQTINILSKQLADISALTSTITNQAKHTSAKYVEESCASIILHPVYTLYTPL